MNTYPELDEDYEKPIDFLGLFLKYISYWKWFVVSVAISTIVGFLYLKTATPIYEVKSTVLLKDDRKGGGMADFTALKDLGMFNVKNNVDNEIEVLKASTLVEQVVRELGLYVNYTQKGFFRNALIYGAQSPLSISLPNEILDTLSTSLSFEVIVYPSGKCQFTGTFLDNDFNVTANIKDSLAALPFGRINLLPGKLKLNKEIAVNVTINSPLRVAQSIMGGLTMELTSKTTSVVNISLQVPSVAMGKDFMSTYIEVYNREDMKDQNLIATNTALFIENRLFTLTKELGSVESEVENYKQNQGLTDISSEAQLFIQQTGVYEQKRLEVETQLSIVSEIDNYMQNKANRYQLLPASTGIQSASLGSLFNDYNLLLLERKRLSRIASPTNQSMIDLTEQIDAMFSTVQASVRNEKRRWLIAQNDLLKKDQENAARIKAIPRQEREYVEIKRQQSIKESLFLFLLQKKEENYLSMSVVVPKAKIIDKARSTGAPVSPKKSLFLMISFIIGIIIPIIGIAIHDMLRYQIDNKEELEEISNVQVLGEIPKNELKGNVVIHENQTDSFTEMVRLLRTNLLFILNSPTKKVINVVSSISGEGKTFVSINLALSLVLLDKKVLIVGLDLRKPKMGEYLDIDNKTGISLYLSEHIKKSELIRPSGIHPKLSVITAGPIPPNPNELLIKPQLDDLITELREQFDYIILDTAPIGVVSDSYSLNRFADVNLYVVRAEYTPKKNIAEATVLFNHNKLSNMYFVLNAVDKKKNSYRYGYGKKYGYGYGYGNKHGNTYGYGNDDVMDKKKK